LPDGIIVLITGSHANLKKSDNKIAMITPIQIAFI